MFRYKHYIIAKGPMILNDNDKKVAGLLILAELSKLNGKSIFNFPVESFISF